MKGGVFGYLRGNGKNIFENEKGGVLGYFDGISITKLLTNYKNLFKFWRKKMIRLSPLYFQRV